MTTTVSRVTLPDLSHLGSKDFERVYEPSDDTFLLVDALAADAGELLRRNPAVCLEVGSGSGCVLAQLGLLLPHATLLGGDINRDACKATAATIAANRQGGDTVQMDLLAAMRPGTVDVLVFNPPYVPTSEEELAEAIAAVDISAAWAGGERGRRVLDRMLPMVGTVLSPSGVFYLLGVQENDRDEIEDIMRETHGMRSRLIAERRAQNKRLFVVRFDRGGP